MPRGGWMKDRCLGPTEAVGALARRSGTLCALSTEAT